MGTSTIKKWAARGAAAATVAVSAALLPGSSATAAVVRPEILSVCNYGQDFHVLVRLEAKSLWPWPGQAPEWTSGPIYRGTCTVITVPKDPRIGGERMATIMVKSFSKQIKTARQTPVDPSRGMHINVRNTFQAPIVARY
ncbi:hypothetical protein [Streptomyces sp. NPDC020681]|uniref:hypothetical protein n=1 Tax=Streptomyces sp. NPDC020681 TaxID=3365083 RepID=UPI003793DC8E